ncbi:MAG: Uma2 family endonuclease [Candidatus Riflebacteria bacterium]|nr:Uma2 family endonuclease [Candidatus Riflebacteria bacterium]
MQIRTGGVKRQIYGRAGVREYWLVDPEARSVTLLALRGRVYREPASGSGDRPLTSAILDGFTFEPADPCE